MIPLIILAIESPEDQASMTAVYLEHERLMYWEINKYIDNKDDADDVLQIALENLIKKLDDLKKKEKHKRSSYILATCRNTSINFLKKCNRIQEYELQDYDGANYYSNPPEEFVVRQDDYDILYAAWKSLDEKSRYFLEARYTLEKPIKEIAKDLGIQENNGR